MPEVDRLVDSGTVIDQDDPFMVPNAAYDFRVSGLHFNSAVTADAPLERAFARVNKEMINASPQPGDASLDGWWIRSATDWSWGSGYKYMEPIDQEPIPYTYEWSYGVDPWNEGELSLLPMPFFNVGMRVTEGIRPQMVAYQGYLYVSNKEWVYRYSLSEFLKPNNHFDPPRDPWIKLPSNVTQLVVAQGYLLASTAANGMFWLTADAQAKSVFTASNPSPIKAWYVKDRIILAHQNKLYEQTISDPYTPKVLSNPFYTNPQADWQWLTVSATPAAILVAGRGQDTSNILSITIESEGGLPKLGAPIVVSEFPSGESVTDIKAYLGSVLMIATTSGVRLGLVSDTGTVTYGPLLGCPRVTGPFSVYDRFAFAPVADAGEGRSGLIRFDLSRISNEQKVAWAFDIRVNDPMPEPPSEYKVLDSLVVTDQVMVMVGLSWRGVGIFSVQPGCDTEPYGVIQSGQIRMGSTVPKAWARFSLSCDKAMRGAVRAEIVTPTGVYKIGEIRNPEYEVEWSFSDLGLQSAHAAIRLTLARGAFPDVPVPPPPPPDPPSPEPNPNPPPEPGPAPKPGEQSWNKLRVLNWGDVKGTFERWQDIAKVLVTVTAGTTGEPSTATPIVEGWALRGQPSIPRTELIKVGLLCFDQEINNQGVKVGGDGVAIRRYQELVKRLAPNHVVKFEDLNNKVTDYVTVDEMSYRQMAAPSVGSGFGGVIDLVMRVS